MTLPTNIATWLKLIGAISVGLGSLLLAWRVKVLLKWVIYSIASHEVAISQLIRLLSQQGQTELIPAGVPKHLIDVESKLALVLFILGFALLGAGMLCNAASYLYGGI